MKTINVIENNGIYSCDIDISKEEWLMIMKDDDTPQSYKEAVLSFFYYPTHRASCTAVCNMMGGNQKSLNANIRNLGEYVQKRLGRFQINHSDGGSCYWIIPMCEGKSLPKGGEGTFEWQLRPELVDAINDYLYWFLVERYKKFRTELGQDWAELYKWQLITVSKGKAPLEIISDGVTHSSKATLGGFVNLIDAARDNKTLKYLLSNHPNELQEVLSKLTDESQPLNIRLAVFKSAMINMLPDNGFGSKANDERTASVILTCVNPQKYTIYKYEIYSLFCKYLGIEKKITGQCYSHFLNLLKPLRDIVAQDEELQQLISTSLQGQIKSDMLLAQDVLWILFSSFSKKLDFIYPFLFPNKQRVWLWSIDIASGFRETLEIGSSAKTIKDFRPYKSRNSLRKAYQKDVGNKDLKIPDAYWSFINEVSVGDIVVAFEPRKGYRKQYHLLHGWGYISSDCIVNEANDNPMSRTVQWCGFLTPPIRNEEMSNRLFFLGTTDKQALHIKELLNINTTTIMESRYQKYIDLLKANKNLILTGAPGTGKTFLAKVIAKEMNAEIGFVQFHPSYDYTDFVEGLRPISQDDADKLGFELRNGVFKEFCINALNSKDGIPSYKKIYKKLLSKIHEGEIETLVLKTGKQSQLLRARGDSILFVNPSMDKYDEANTVTWNRLSKLLDNGYNSIDKFNNIKNIDKEIRYVIGGCNSTNYWAVLNYILNNSKDIIDEKKVFVFIIDEINRGEISKIFGELFFSIDPGYRGEEGRVTTQYQNMIEDGDVFKDGFYVPKNVYIIALLSTKNR